jgi:acid phosphatase
MTRVFALLGAALFLTGRAEATDTVTLNRPDVSARVPMPAWRAKKVVLLILENKGPEAAAGEPFLQKLVTEGAYLASYYAVAHPSQPNCVALVSGSTEGVSGDAPVSLNRAHLGRFVGWKAYAEGYPRGTCDLRAKIGRYVRKHAPFLSFDDVTNFDEFMESAQAHHLPQFSLVVLDLDNDSHDQPLRLADAWLERFFGPLLTDEALRRDVLLIVTYDENDASRPYPRSGNKVYAVMWGADVQPEVKVETIYDHYDLLRTIEAMFGVTPMAIGDRKARVIDGIWRKWI